MGSCVPTVHTAAAQVRELAAQTIHYDKHYAGWNLADALVGQLWFKQASALCGLQRPQPPRAWVKRHGARLRSPDESRRERKSEAKGSERARGPFASMCVLCLPGERRSTKGRTVVAVCGRWCGVLRVCAVS